MEHFCSICVLFKWKTLENCVTMLAERQTNTPKNISISSYTRTHVEGIGLVEPNGHVTTHNFYHPCFHPFIHP